MRERANKCLSAAECKLHALAIQQSMCCATKEKKHLCDFFFFFKHAIYKAILCFEEQ